MITPFVGEFMFHPAPLEVSGNTCVHGCIYCFANIRKESRYSKIKSVLKQLSKKKVVTWTDHLIQTGNPICISNQTDPFSPTDIHNTIAMCHHLAAMPNGIFWQTKGGEGIDDVLEILKEKKNQVWYISLSIKNPEIIKRVEGNAFTYQGRIDLAKKLIDKGYMVIIAMNPLFEDWLPFEDFVDMYEDCKKIGVNHFVIEPLHLNLKEVETFSKWRRSKFSDEEIERAVDIDKTREYSIKAYKHILDDGGKAMKIAMPYRSDFFIDIRNALGKGTPNHYDYINYCFDKLESSKNDYVIFTYDEFLKITKETSEDFFTFKTNEFKNYVFKQSFSTWKGNTKVQTMNDFEYLLNVNWNEKRIKQSLQHNVLFRKLQDMDGNDILDSNGNIQLYFDGTINRNKPDRLKKWLGELNYVH